MRSWIILDSRKLKSEWDRNRWMLDGREPSNLMPFHKFTIQRFVNEELDHFGFPKDEV
jgi:hypothetical protein